MLWFKNWLWHLRKESRPIMAEKTKKTQGKTKAPKRPKGSPNRPDKWSAPAEGIVWERPIDAPKNDAPKKK